MTGRVRGGVLALAALAALALVAGVVVGLAQADSGDPAGPTYRVIDRVGSEGRSVVEAPTVQGGAPGRVRVESVELSREGYVAVYASVDGAPGQVLGTSERLEPGRRGPMHVTLRRPVRRRSAVVVVLHSEDGEAEGLGFPEGDPPFTDDDGGVVALAVTITPD